MSRGGSTGCGCSKSFSRSADSVDVERLFWIRFILYLSPLDEVGSALELAMGLARKPLVSFWSRRSSTQLFHSLVMDLLGSRNC
jgi:hypothetical protein